jgi:hypothetical protein
MEDIEVVYNRLFENLVTTKILSNLWSSLDSQVLIGRDGWRTRDKDGITRKLPVSMFLDTMQHIHSDYCIINEEIDKRARTFYKYAKDWIFCANKFKLMNKGRFWSYGKEGNKVIAEHNESVMRIKEHNKNVIKKLGKELAIYFLPEDF